MVPGQVLESLIKQDDRQRYLEHHYPLVPTQWGHLENELEEEGLVKGRTAQCPAIYLLHHSSYNGLFVSVSKMPLEVPPPGLYLSHFLCLKYSPQPSLTGPNPIWSWWEVGGILNQERVESFLLP